jgi:uncharacterized repeat protein (TIGR01451 family)
MLLGVGVGMCLLAYPAGVFANGTKVTAPAASSSTSCPASLPSTFPDPVFPAAAQNNYFNDAEAATTDTNLPSGFVGPGTGATTGTATAPVPAAAFGIGYFDETELHESTASSFPHTELAGIWPGTAGGVGQTGTIATDSGTLTHTTAGAAAFGSATEAYGVGQPYAAILTPDLKTILVAKVPTQVLYEGYTPNPTGGHVNYSGVMSNCGNGPLYAILGFDVTKYNLDPNTTYAAYILMSDTDSSGPLANHIWYFRFSPPPPPQGTLKGRIFRCDNGSQTQTEVPGGTISATPGSLSGSDTGSGVSFTVAPNSYLVSAAAPSGFEFVSCGSLNYTPSADGLSATYKSSLAVPANGSAEADFYVTPIPQPSTLLGRILRCDSGSQTHTEVPGGTISATPGSLSGSDTGAGVSFSVAAGSYRVSAQAPSGWQFVTCGSTDYTPSADQLSATYNHDLVVPPSQEADFYVVATPGPSFEVAKAVSPTGKVPINTDLTYTVTVTNNGQSAGSPGKLTDTLTASGGATCSIKTAASVTQGTVTSPPGCPGTWSWNLAHVTLQPGDTATLTVVITAISPGALTNVAVLPGSNCAAGSSDPKCSTNTPVTLLLTKTENGVAGPINVSIGDTITYVVTVTNNSDNPAHNVLVDDDMGGTAGFSVDDKSFTSNDSAQVSKQSSGHYTWTFATIDAGTAASVQFNAVILSPGTTTSTINGTISLTNTATVDQLPPVTVVANAPASGVKAASTPGTGGFPDMNASVAGFMFLGGLGMILLGMLARRPRLNDLTAG